MKDIPIPLQALEAIATGRTVEYMLHYGLTPSTLFDLNCKQIARHALNSVLESTPVSLTIHNRSDRVIRVERVQCEHGNDTSPKSFVEKVKAEFKRYFSGEIVVEIDERVCHSCGCTDSDCQQCIEKTGKPCHWVSPGLCSACVPKD